MNTKLSEIPVPAYAEIVDEWYKAMGENNISVQPKASTILGTILANYDISPKQEIDPDTTGGDFANFWKNLSDTEKAYVEEKRQQARDKFYSSRNLVDDKKTLLKG